MYLWSKERCTILWTWDLFMAPEAVTEFFGVSFHCESATINAHLIYQLVCSWRYVVRTLDSGETVKLQYRSLTKTDEEQATKELQPNITTPNWLWRVCELTVIIQLLLYSLENSNNLISSCRIQTLNRVFVWSFCSCRYTPYFIIKSAGKPNALVRTTCWRQVARTSVLLTMLFFLVCLSNEMLHFFSLIQDKWLNSQDP